MLASLASATLLGVEGQFVHVEVHESHGLPSYTVVGLPDAAIKESRERVRAALLSCGVSWPTRRITVNLAPGDTRKSGSGLELAIALGLLQTNSHLPQECVDNFGVLGELGLDGSVRPISGVLALVDTMHSYGIQHVIVPYANAAEASLVENVHVYPARSLMELRACLKDEAPWPEIPHPKVREVPENEDLVDLADVRGLASARVGLAVAAAGNHHLLLLGPPGAGKTMLARCLPKILPPLSSDEALEVTRIHSAAGVHSAGSLVTQRPFRAPHHTASVPALVGGGSLRPRPGEVTLAHRGVLFLDELGEFNPRALDALRQPLEERCMRVARQAGSLTFPSEFVLIACSNPCACGRSLRDCTCSDVQRARYIRRLSAPLLDRFDVRLVVSPPDIGEIATEDSATVHARVLRAVERQSWRLRDTPWIRNAHIPAPQLREFAPLSVDAKQTWLDVCKERQFSGRGADRVHRVARTLADLDDKENIEVEHVILAASLRQDMT